MLALTCVVDLSQGLWFDEPWSQHLTEVVVIVVMLAVGVTASTRTFRWEREEQYFPLTLASV